MTQTPMQKAKKRRRLVECLDKLERANDEYYRKWLDPAMFNAAPEVD